MKSKGKNYNQALSMTKNKRILVVEVNWLGDVLFSTAALRWLRRQYPESFIACLLHSRCKEVLAGNPYIDELIILDEEKAHRGTRGKRELIKTIRARRFDTVYFFHRSFTRVLICYLAGIPHRIGYARLKSKFLLTQALTPPEGRIHRAAYFMYVAAGKLITDKEHLRGDFFVDEKDGVFVRGLLEKENVAENDSVVVMHSAGNWPPKRWPQHLLAALADLLIERYGCRVVFSGSEKEQQLITEIVAMMKQKPINFCGKTSLKQLGALFKRADLCISADSGPLHIAVALGRPTVALFGPTDQEITGPLAGKDVSVLQKDVGCEIPCYNLECKDNRCMAAISVADVIGCIEKNKWLKEKK